MRHSGLAVKIFIKVSKFVMLVYGNSSCQEFYEHEIVTFQYLDPKLNSKHKFQSFYRGLFHWQLKRK